MTITSIIVTIFLLVVSSYSAGRLVDHRIVNIGCKNMTDVEKNVIVNIGSPLILLIGTGLGLLYLLSAATLLVMRVKLR